MEEGSTGHGGVLTEDKKTWYPSEGALKGSLTADIGKLSRR
jgi:hypothetical protein